MPGPLVIPNVASMPDFEGTDLGFTDWHQIDQAQINRFAAATGDHQWIHVDPERAAKESPFGGTIAHGYLTIALAPVLLPQIVQVAQVSQIVNVGLEKVRLREPVRVDSKIRLGAKVTSVRAMKADAMRVVMQGRFEVEGVRRPVCTADLMYVYFG